MSDALDSFHREFAAYRQTHRRGAYPLVLRRRAVVALDPGQLLQLAARLGLTAQQVARWQGQPKPHHETQGFFQVSATPRPQATPTDECTVEVEIRSGATLKLRGNIDRHLPVLIEALLQRAGT